MAGWGGDVLVIAALSVQLSVIVRNVPLAHVNQLPILRL